jgi:hypothetical protein
MTIPDPRNVETLGPPMLLDIEAVVLFLIPNGVAAERLKVKAGLTRLYFESHNSSLRIRPTVRLRRRRKQKILTGTRNRRGKY